MLRGKTLPGLRSLSAFVCFGALAGLWGACGTSSTSSSTGGSGGGTTGTGGTTGNGGTTVVPDDGGVPEVDAGEVDSNPTSPTDDGGGKLAWPEAPLLEDVSVAANRDSAQIVLPVVAGAQDYRVFAIPAGVLTSRPTRRGGRRCSARRFIARGSASTTRLWRRGSCSAGWRSRGSRR